MLGDRAVVVDALRSRSQLVWCYLDSVDTRCSNWSPEFLPTGVSQDYRLVTPTTQSILQSRHVHTLGVAIRGVSPMLKHQLRTRLERATTLYVDLIDHIPEQLLASRLGDLPSNTIGAQLWCVIGARDSYVRAAKAGSWQGFECPLDASSITDANAVRDALTSTGRQVSDYLNDSVELSEPAVTYLFDLLEHEAQHHGQLARYLYGLKVGVPQSWKDRYHFD